MQLFQSVIFNHEDGIRPFASMERIKRVSTTLTFRAGTGYLGDTILPDIFIRLRPGRLLRGQSGAQLRPPGNESSASL
jgi:hypothetical protein